MCPPAASGLVLPSDEVHVWANEHVSHLVVRGLGYYSRVARPMPSDCGAPADSIARTCASHHEGQKELRRALGSPHVRWPSAGL